MGKKNVHRLSADQSSSLVLFGLSSHENDYRLSWAFNEFLGFRFIKGENHKVFNTKTNETQEFSLFIFADSDNGITYRLISNRCPNGFLLDEFKNIDFLLLLSLDDDFFRIPEFVAKIKTIPLVSAIFHIDISKVKGKNKLP